MLKKLLELGNLGQKTKAGFFKKVGRDVLRFDLEAEEYVPGGQKADEVYGRMLKKPAAERLKLLRNAEGAQGQFLWAILRNSFHYAAVHLGTIADNARDVDLCHALGLWHEAGPVRAVARSRLARSGQDDPGRHRRRQGAQQGAAARVGVQGPRGRGRWRAHRARFVERFC